MEVEHGIVFNKPYVLPGIFPTQITKHKYKNSGQGSNSAHDRLDILIPLAVVDEKVFCISMLTREFNGPAEYELSPSPYPGSPPMTQTFYWGEIEALAYYTMIPIKDFVKDWKVKE